MQLSRRQVMTSAGVAGLVGALGLSFTEAAVAVPQLQSEDFDILRDRWVDQLTGRNLYDPADELFRTHIDELDANVQDFLDRLGEPVRTRSFRNGLGTMCGPSPSPSNGSG